MVGALRRQNTLSGGTFWWSRKSFSSLQVAKVCGVKGFLDGDVP